MMLELLVAGSLVGLYAFWQTLLPKPPLLWSCLLQLFPICGTLLLEILKADARFYDELEGSHG